MATALPETLTFHADESCLDLLTPRDTLNDAFALLDKVTIIILLYFKTFMAWHYEQPVHTTGNKGGVATNSTQRPVMHY